MAPRDVPVTIIASNVRSFCVVFMLGGVFCLGCLMVLLCGFPKCLVFVWGGLKKVRPFGA